MRRWWLWVLLVVPGTAWAGAQINADQEQSYYCSITVTDAAITNTATVGNGEGVSCNQAALGSNLVAGVARNSYVATRSRLVIEEWGVTLTAAVGGGTEDCNLVLMSDNLTTGAGSAVSTITTSTATAETECAAGTINLDAAGETCVVNNFVANITGGGYWRIEWIDRDGAGANTCASWADGTVWVRGRLQPQ